MLIIESKHPVLVLLVLPIVKLDHIFYLSSMLIKCRKLYLISSRLDFIVVLFCIHRPDSLSILARYSSLDFFQVGTLTAKNCSSHRKQFVSSNRTSLQ